MQKLDKYLKIIWRAIIIISLILALILLVLSPRHLSSEPGSNSSVPKPTTTTLFFAGDIMLSRNVAKKIYAANDSTLPFKKVQDGIAGADIAFANLESPFNDQGNHVVEGSLVFNADPKSVEGLKYAGFDILSTANNHALDQGTKGLDFTIDTLMQNGIIPTGTIKTDSEPILPVISKNKIAFGFLSYSYAARNDGGKSSSPYVNNFNDLVKLKQDILNLRGHYADVVIVNMHAGTEYTGTPTPQQVAFAHAAIDAGADLVVGEHPHWIQTIEQYQGKWIFYSLGNFVFDQMWSQNTREGLTLSVIYQNQHIPDLKGESAGEDKIQIQKIELKPVIIDDYSTPRWATSDETKAILGRLGLTSGVLLDNN